MRPSLKMYCPAHPGCWKMILRGSLVLLGITCLRSPALAQARPYLSFQRESGLSITGAQGRLYAIETSTDFSQPGSWHLLTAVRITTNPVLVPGTMPSGEA